MKRQNVGVEQSGDFKELLLGARGRALGAAVKGKWECQLQGCSAILVAMGLIYKAESYSWPSLGHPSSS